MNETGHMRAAINAVSRRRFLAGIGSAALGVAFLTACGGDSNNEDSPGTSTPTGTADGTATGTATSTGTAAAPAASGAFPVTVEHKFGATEVPARPERVLSLGYNDHDAILALGVTPIATRYWFGEQPGAIFPWAQASLAGDTPEVLEMPYGELDFERIAALRPDLIVGIYAGITAEEYETLSAIAPVIAQSPDYIDFGMPWDEGARILALALGEVEAMEEVIAGVEAKFDAAAEAHPEFADKELILAALRADGQIGLFAEQDGRMRFFTRLGFQPAESLSGMFGESFYTNISAEQINLLDTGDVVGWTQVVYAGGPDAILEHPVYSTLPVAQERRHFLLGDLADAAFSFNSVLSLPFAIENVVPQVAAALDGDPETNVDYQPAA